MEVVPALRLDLEDLDAKHAEARAGIEARATSQDRGWATSLDRDRAAYLCLKHIPDPVKTIDVQFTIVH